MAYKDKDRQREANRRAQARFKAKAKGITNGGVTLPKDADLGNTLTTTQTVGIAVPRCWCCGADIPIGTVCCGPCAWSGKAKANRAGATPPVLTESKRGKDIKRFADLPPDVQATIDRLGEDNSISRAMRIANAIHYHHLFPDRYQSTGVA